MKLISEEDLKKEYLELKKQKKFSDNEILNYFMDKLENDYLITKCNGIHVYMGTYKLVHKYSDSWYPVSEVLVDENDLSAEYKAFKELNTGLKKCINIGKDMEDFEKDNIIIFIPNVRNFEREFTFEQDFKKLRKLYFKELFIKDEKAAISTVTSEQWIEETFSVKNYLNEINISSVFYQTFFEAALCNKKQNSNGIVLTKAKKR